MPRPYWKGHVRISLISFPVQLHTAIASSPKEKVQFHQIHRPTGERVRYQKVVPGLGEVDKDEIVKGYEYERGRYVTIDPEEIDELKVEGKHTIDVNQFVDEQEIDPLYEDRPYYLTPDGEFAEEAFRVIREALRETGKVALGQLVLSGREHIIAIRPHGRGMVVETLRYADEVRPAERYFEDIRDEPVDPEQVALAKQIIGSRTAPFDPSRFEDHYQQALEELVRAKLEGAPPPEVREERPPARVYDLMDALRRSVESEQGKTEADAGGSAAAPERRGEPAEQPERREEQQPQSGAQQKPTPQKRRRRSS